MIKNKVVDGNELLRNPKIDNSTDITYKSKESFHTVSIIDYEEISMAMASQGEYFALRIKGKSMEPKFSDGDVVIVRKQEDLESGEIGVIIVNGCDATVKKVIKQENGILLIANNQEVYPPKYYSRSDIENLPVRILGRVVELRGEIK